MNNQLVHGFKTLAERTAASVRSELGLQPDDRLDTSKLADHLGVQVVSVRELKQDGAGDESIARLLSEDAGFSALTVCLGERRMIVFNPDVASTRQSNSLAHELSHVILEHPPATVAFDSGCRVWNGRQEEEADWLAAALLVPREGALRWLAKGGTPSTGARHFGVSPALFTWRMNQTGILYQLRAKNRRSHSS
jgi:Zn-dependent peptidase ImmA (M78 family)